MSDYRKDLNAKKDQAFFSRTADRTHYFNSSKLTPKRGGYRL